MFFIESIAQAWSSLKGHKLRTALTMFGIIWGIASMIFLVGIGRSSQKLFHKEFKKVGDRNIYMFAGKDSSGLSGIKGGRQIRFTIDDIRAIKAHCPDVEMVTPFIRLGIPESKYGSESLTAETSGVDVNANIIRNLFVESGRFIIRDDVELSRRVCVLGANVKEKLFGPQTAVGEFIRLHGIRFEVVGVLKKKGDQMTRISSLDDDQISIPYTTAQRLFTGSKYFYMIYARPYSIPRESAARQQIRETLAIRHNFDIDDTDALDMFGTTDMLKKVDGATNAMQLFLGLASVVTLLLGGVGVMNIMFVSINERIREIGIIKAVGAKKRHVFQKFLIESIFITFFAGFIGLFLGCATCLALGMVKISPYVAAPEIDPVVMAISFSCMALVGVLSGILPALKASRMQIVEALRFF